MRTVRENVARTRCTPFHCTYNKFCIHDASTWIQQSKACAQFTISQPPGTVQKSPLPRCVMSRMKLPLSNYVTNLSNQSLRIICRRALATIHGSIFFLCVFFPVSPPPSPPPPPINNGRSCHVLSHDHEITHCTFCEDEPPTVYNQVPCCTVLVFAPRLPHTTHHTTTQPHSATLR